MTNRGELAVHDASGTDDFSAKEFANALVPQADAKNGYLSLECIDDCKAVAGLCRRAGAGRDEDTIRIEGECLVSSDLIVAHNLLLHPQLTEVLDEVVGKGVEVVDDEHHGAWNTEFKWEIKNAKCLLDGKREGGPCEPRGR